MFDTRKIEDYIKDTGVAKVGENRYYNIRSILNHVSNCEQKLEKDFSEFSVEDITSMFSEKCRTSVRLSSFRAEITGFLLWYANKYQVDVSEMIRRMKVVNSKTVLNAAGDSMAISYFSSQEKFILFLEKLNHIKYYDARALLILYWFGFTRDKIVLLKKDDLDEPSLSIARKQIGEPFFSMLKDYANLTQIDVVRETPNAGRMLETRYCVGEYLFRIPITKRVLKKKENNNESIEPVSEHYLSQNIMRKVKACEDISGKKLKAQCLFVNKIFIDIRNEELRTGGKIIDKGSRRKVYLEVPENIKRILDSENPSDSDSINFLRLYLCWRKYYYKE